MAETTSDQEQQMKSQQTSDVAPAQPAVEAPLPELDGMAPLLSRGPGLGSPDGIEQRASDSRLSKNANRQVRAQTLSALQRQMGNQHVQRFMVQRRQADRLATVQREEGDQAKPQGDKEAASNSVKIDEAGVTQAIYDPPALTTKDETPTPSADAKPGEDKYDVTGTVVGTFTVRTKVSLPPVPSGLSTCQAKRFKDAVDNQLSPHENQHVAAMQLYNGTFETSVTVKGVTKAAAPAALIAAGKPLVDAEGAKRKKTAQDTSDALDKPPFIINVNLDCEDEKKPGKKDVKIRARSRNWQGGGGDQGRYGRLWELSQIWECAVQGNLVSTGWSIFGWPDGQPNPQCKEPGL